MSGIKEFSVVVGVSIVVYTVFSSVENFSNAVDSATFVFVFYYLYSANEEVFRIDKSTLSGKVIPTFAILLATTLGSRILSQIILGALNF